MQKVRVLPSILKLVVDLLPGTKIVRERLILVNVKAAQHVILLELIAQPRLRAYHNPIFVRVSQHVTVSTHPPLLSTRIA